MLHNPSRVTLTSHKQKQSTRMVTKLTCKKHGVINIKYDKLLNVGGKKFCPHCLAEFLMESGVCLLEKSREKIPVKSKKSKKRGNGGYRNKAKLPNSRWLDIN